MSVAVDRVCSRLTGLKKAGSGWVARCPAHDDKIQSLSIGEGDDGRALLYCHAGCPPGDVLQAIDLTLADLFSPAAEKPSSQPLATYTYCAMDGTVLFEVLRFPPKQFCQRRPDGKGGWLWSLTGVSRVPYRLPDLQNIKTVVIVEGERDADRLWSLGIPATTNAAGAGKWRHAETQALKAAGCQRVIILPDNDEAGTKHADQVATRCKAAGLSVSVPMLPGLGPHGDVSDWLNAGHTKDELEDLFAKPYVLPSSGPAPLKPVPATDTFDPLAYHYSHTGAAEAFRDRFGDRIRYDHDRERWILWNHHSWRPDADAGIERLFHQHVRLWAHEAVAVADWTARKNLQAYTLKLEKRGEMTAALATSQSLPPIAVSGDSWDHDPWLLGCPNGVVDLRTGHFTPGKKDQLITQRAGPDYNPDATCPRWLTFLSEIFDDDETMIGFVHRALGYSLTGSIAEQCFFLAIGTGSNGKSLFLNTLETVWGTYGLRSNMRLFVGFGDADKYHLADLESARLIFASETKPDMRMNEVTIKNVTGGESLRAEHKFGHPFTFRPIGKVWLGVNHEPKVVDDSFGFWRRVRLIPFRRTFTGSADDRNLRDKLRVEAPGILAWVVQGALKWQSAGLVPPVSVMDATDRYQAEEDPLAEFFADRVEFEAEAISSFAAIYAAYTKWAERQGIKSSDRLSRRVMGSNLKRRFDTKDLDGTRRYVGIRLKPDGGVLY